MKIPLGATGSITTLNANVASGTPTAGSYVQIPGLQTGTTMGSAPTAMPPDVTEIGVSVSGTYTGALTARATVDGVNWFALAGSVFTNTNTGAVSSTIASGATGLWTVNVAAFQGFRINAEAAVTGTATVSMSASQALIAPQASSSASAWCLTAAVPQSGTASVVIASAAFLLKVVTTTSGSAATTIYDNATTGSGTIIGYIPASPGIGTVYTFNAPAVNGITINGGANQSALVVYYL